MRALFIAFGACIAILVLFAAGGCSSGPDAATPRAGALADHGFASGLYVRRVPQATQGCAILLPGASGLDIFDDHGHYDRAAAAFGELGLDTIIVDYKKAYRGSPSPPPGETGEKIAWVIRETIRMARDEGVLRDGERVVLVAWSLGAEGLWPILQSAELTSSLSIERAIAYYPSNEEAVSIRTAVPLLLLVGELDDVTPLADLKATVAAGAGPVDLVTFPQAHHGFDITSLEKPRRVSLIPIIGPSGTFALNAAAARGAWERIGLFLRTAR